MKKTIARIMICVFALGFYLNIAPVKASAEEEHLCSLVMENDTYYSHFRCNVCGAFIVMTENGAVEVPESSVRKLTATQSTLAEGTVVYVDTTGSENIVATIVPDPTTGTTYSPTTSTTTTTTAQSIRSGYNVSSAVSWATSNAYINQSTDSCAAYISNVLYYGGGLVSIPRFNYVGELVLALVANGYGSLNYINAYNIYALQAGDIIVISDPTQYTGDLTRFGTHCMFVTGVDYANGIVYYCQHNPVYVNKTVSFSALTSGSFAQAYSSSSQIAFISMNK